jgi:hypothetical protein
MKTSPPGPARKKAGAPAPDKTQRAEDITPPPTGANRGSPAARVMKQFAKTKAESSGRS